MEGAVSTEILSNHPPLRLGIIEVSRVFTEPEGYGLSETQDITEDCLYKTSSCCILDLGVYIERGKGAGNSLEPVQCQNPPDCLTRESL